MNEQEPKERPANGQFQPGNPGRPKGSRNKFTEDFLRDFHATWVEGGLEACRKVMQDKPEAYLGAAVKILPKMVVQENTLNELDREQLERIIEILDRGLAERAEDAVQPALQGFGREASH